MEVELCGTALTSFFFWGVAKSCVKKPSAVIHDALHVGDLSMSIVILEGRQVFSVVPFTPVFFRCCSFEMIAWGSPAACAGKHVVTILD